MLINQKGVAMKGKNKVLMGPEGCSYFSESLKSQAYLRREDEILDIETLAHSKIHLIIEGKELLIEEIIIPRARKPYMESMIEHTLIEKFHTLDEIAFDFKVMKKEKNKIRVLVYCVNLSNSVLLEKDKFQRIHLQSVKVIQQIYAEAFRKFLRKKEFYGIAIIKNYFYFFHVKNKVLCENKVEDLSSFHDLKDFVKSLCKSMGKSKVLYLYEENPCKEVSKLLKSIQEVYIFNIDFIRKEKSIFNYISNSVEA